MGSEYLPLSIQANLPGSRHHAAEDELQAWRHETRFYTKSDAGDWSSSDPGSVAAF